MSAYDNAHYHARSIESKKRKVALQLLRKKSISEKIREYKANHGCMDCGEKDVVVLELDHRNPQDKTSEVSNLLNRGQSLAKVMLEVEKCDVVCANCHRRRTARDFNWFLKP